MTNQASVLLKHHDPKYVAWRAELLAKLSLARVPDLVVHEFKDEQGYDLLARTETNLCFVVEAKGFSSMHQGISDSLQAQELKWTIDADRVRTATESKSPVFLFLFDADTDHGRYCRLDTMPMPEVGRRSVTLSFPVENTISRESIERLVADLEAVETQSRAVAQ